MARARGLDPKPSDPEEKVATPDWLPPANLCNATALRKATRRISQMFDDVLAPAGLRSTQRSILAHIARAGVPTMGELAAALVLDRSALAHNLKPLERDGLVAMRPDTSDRRSRRVALTTAGMTKLKSSMPLFVEAQRRFESAFGAGRAEELRRVLVDVAALEFDEGSEGSVQEKTGE
jgi:DNA-binding MarR family transcriptional regulator